VEYILLPLLLVPYLMIVFKIFLPAKVQIYSFMHGMYKFIFFCNTFYLSIYINGSDIIKFFNKNMLEYFCY